MRDKWNELSMYDRNKFIEVAVRNGLRDPQEIRNKYNEFAEGGALSEPKEIQNAIKYYQQYGYYPALSKDNQAILDKYIEGIDRVEHNKEVASEVGLDPNNSIIGPDVEVSPTWLQLNTYYPVVSNYPFTGHSSLTASTPESSAYIDKRTKDADYNLFTNNCSDATREVLEAITGKNMDPLLFTTPGDTRDFFLENFPEAIKVNDEAGTDKYKTTISEGDLNTFNEYVQKQFDINNKAVREELIKKRIDRHQATPSDLQWAKENNYVSRVDINVPYYSTNTSIKANGGGLSFLDRPFSYKPISKVRYANGGHLFSGEEESSQLVQKPDASSPIYRKVEGYGIFDRPKHQVEYFKDYEEFLDILSKKAVQDYGVTYQQAYDAFTSGKITYGGTTAKNYWNNKSGKVSKAGFNESTYNKMLSQLYKDNTAFYNKFYADKGIDNKGVSGVTPLKEYYAKQWEIPYDESQKIKLSVGRFRGGITSTKLLDAIAESAKEAGLPLEVALGIAGKESNVGWAYGQLQNGMSPNLISTVSAWNSLGSAPLGASVVNEAERIKTKYLSGEDITENDYKFIKDYLQYLQYNIQRMHEPTENPMTYVFRRFAQGYNGNPGDPDNRAKAYRFGEQLINDPAIRQYYLSTGALKPDIPQPIPINIQPISTDNLQPLSEIKFAYGGPKGRVYEGEGEDNQFLGLTPNQWESVGSTTKNVLSYFPIVGSAIDIYDAVNNSIEQGSPDWLGIGNAAVSVGLDALGIGAAKKAYKGYKAVQAAYKGLEAAKTAEIAAAKASQKAYGNYVRNGMNKAGKQARNVTTKYNRARDNYSKAQKAVYDAEQKLFWETGGYSSYNNPNKLYRDYLFDREMPILIPNLFGVGQNYVQNNMPQ